MNITIRVPFKVLLAYVTIDYTPPPPPPHNHTHEESNTAYKLKEPSLYDKKYRPLSSMLPACKGPHKPLSYTKQNRL